MSITDMAKVRPSKLFLLAERMLDSLINSCLHLLNLVHLMEHKCEQINSLNIGKENIYLHITL